MKEVWYAITPIVAIIAPIITAYINNKHQRRIANDVRKAQTNQELFRNLVKIFSEVKSSIWLQGRISPRQHAALFEAVDSCLTIIDEHRRQEFVSLRHELKFIVYSNDDIVNESSEKLNFAFSHTPGASVFDEIILFVCENLNSPF